MILFVLLGIVILIIFEIRARKSAHSEQGERPIANSEASDSRNEDDGCCGEHLVCERETLLQTNAEIIYYDDEELDRFRGHSSDGYSEEEIEEFREVMYTCKEDEVAGWSRSLQLRGIELPDELKDELFLIVGERRFK